MTTLIIPKEKNFKELRNTLKAINDMESSKLVVIKKPGADFNDAFADLEKNATKGYQLTFSDTMQTYQEMLDIEHITLETKYQPIVCPKLYITNWAIDKVTAEINCFRSEPFVGGKSVFCRLVIPILENISLNFFFDLFHYRTYNLASSQCIRIKYDMKDVDVYICTDKTTEQRYLIVESLDVMHYKCFNDYCFSTLVGFGFITGKFFQNEGYFFYYDEPDMDVVTGFEYREFRNSLHSLYPPVYRNPHGFIRDRSIANSLMDKLKPISAKVFSKLCKLIHESVEFSSLVLMMIEANSASLMVAPAAYSVILEGLATQAVAKKKGVSPIKDPMKAKQIKKELLEVLDRHLADLDTETVRILKNKLEQINQATNSSKLLQPFEHFKIVLTAEDKMAIQHRNDFLHGEITLIKKQGIVKGQEAIDKANRYLYYVSMRLLTLNSMLILKMAGYSGYIKNFPKIHEKGHREPVNESFVREI